MTVNDPPPAGVLGPVGNLPAESNTFVGRGRDLGDLTGILDRARSLTLCGPGGIGKTRLATQLAARLADRFTDGVWLADQADAASADRLVPLLSAAIGIRAEPGRPLAETLADALRPRTMLLILDTCDHLVQESAELVEWLLSHCPRLRVIATSTEPLRLRGEVIWRVPPLGLPGPAAPGDAPADLIAQSEAVQLFLARAAAVRPGFELTEANAPAVADICRTLDGVPLAIELAAARLRTLSAEQIKLRLAGRFELLAIGDRTAPQRQQTLRATVEWSYDLLTEAEKLLLGRLSVFHGFSLELAEQASADHQIRQAQVLDLLTALIDKSLVSVDHEGGGDTWYRLLDTVRQFAAERTGAAELARMHQVHRNCMLGLAESMADSVLADSASWQDRVSAWRRAMPNLTNFNLALAYCADHGDAAEGLRLCNLLRIPWLVAGDPSGAAWLDKFLASEAPVPAGIRSSAFVARAEIAFEQQDLVTVADCAAAALELAAQRDDGNPAGAQRMLALVALAAAQLDDALAYADGAIATARKRSETWEEGVSLAIRAAIVASQGDLAGANDTYQQALDTLGESRGWGAANVRYGRGRLARITGDQEGAQRYFSAALALYRQVDARPEMARCLAGLGQLALERGDLATAQAHLIECTELSLAIGQRVAISRSLTALAELHASREDLETAVRLAAAARRLCAETSGPATAAGAQSATRRLTGLIDAAKVTMGPAAVAAAVADGTAQSHHQVARHAIARLLADQAAGQPGDPASARPGPATRPAAAWPGPLTEREREVAVLVAAAGSNRAIAEQLSISTATVARHIANIYEKLGFNSRAQLIAWVMNARQGELALPRPAGGPH